MTEGLVSRGFRGCRGPTDDARLPPGQYLESGFPVLSAGPTPRTPLSEWYVTLVGEIDEPLRWTWEQFLALPSEEVTRDIHFPTASLGADSFSLWGVTSAPRDGELVPTDRWGTPLVQHIFINHDYHLADEYNRARPEGDPKTYGAHVSGFVEKLTAAAGTARDPAAHGRHVAEMLLPNVVPYDTREPAGYGPQARNGRAMADDVYDVMVSLVANTSLSDGVDSDGDHLAGLPYLAPPKELSPELPPLVPREAG